MTTTTRRALLAADTDHIQKYVFESARLPEIRGASIILTELNEQAAPQTIQAVDPNAEKIYAGGGGLLYEVDADQAQAIQQALEALYPGETGVATTTCVFRELSGPADQGIPTLPVEQEHIAALSPFQQKRWQEADRDLSDFGAWVRLLGHDLRRRKQEKRYAPFVETPPHAERCQACRTRPAALVHPHYGDPLALCPECAQKNEHSERAIWRDRFEDKLKTWYPESARRYFGQYDKGAVPMDISVIASACAPRNHNKQNYVAFIYADGDGVGAFVESQRTRADFERMSHLLDEATWRAVTFALANNLALQPLDNPLYADATGAQRLRVTQPFEIIAVGGDDVMLIVPAHAALRIAHDMATTFRRFMDEQAMQEGARRLSLSVGIVIAPAHTPVRLMRDFAEELLKKGAKPRAKEAGEAAIDFQIFTSTAIYGAGVMSLRNHAPYAILLDDAPTARARPLRLYYRPYTLTELDRLLNALQALDAVSFPTSQLAQLAQALERGRRRATLFYLYQRSRLSGPHREALARVEAIIAARDKEDPSPWYKARRSDMAYAFNTTLRDVAELYDFIPESEEVYV